MPKIYSIDLRKKVMQHYRETNHKSNTCKTFKISRTTLDDWINLEQKTGLLKQPKLNVGRPPVIKDLQEFKLFVESAQFKHVKDLQPLFEHQFGYKISYTTLLKTLHKIGAMPHRRNPTGQPSDNSPSEDELPDDQI